MKKLLKLVLAGAMAFSIVGCSSGSDSSESSSTSSAGLTEWHTYQTQANEMDTWNVLYSQGAAVLNVVTNFIDSLLTNDTEGKVLPNLATEYSSNDDATEWTFKLTKDATWVDYTGEYKADVTAADFVTGLEFVLNYAKNSGANSSMAREMIKGADDYYQMTYDEYEATGEVSAETEAKFLDMVGISTPDDYTVVYEMVAPKPYFYTLATYATLYPLSQACLDEYGEDYGIDNETIYYCGPYICTAYENNSYKTLEQNPSWWNADNYTRFEKVTIQMVESADLAWSLFQSGEIDNITLPESALLEVYNSGESNDYYQYLVEMKPTKYAYVWHFNYNSKLEDGSDDVQWNTCIANTKFRQALLYGLDWTSYLKRSNSINPGNEVNDVYTCDGLVFTTDGTDYCDLVREKLEEDGMTMSTKAPDAVHGRYDVDKATKLKEEAMEELEAQGVSFPVTYYYYYKSGDQTGADTAAVFKQMIEEQMGDLMTVEFRTYSESSTTEIIKPEKWSGLISGWGADYGDPINFLGQEIDDTNAFYNFGRSDLTADIDPNFQKFCDMVADADAITDLDERYEAFADAEAYYIENAWSIPLYRNIQWEITRTNDYSHIDSAFGIQSGRYLNWETTADTAYTTADYESFAK